MGHRLHVAKAYKVEYALPDNFNHEVEEFHDLLASLSINYTGDSWDDDFDVYEYNRPFFSDLMNESPVFAVKGHRINNLDDILTVDQAITKSL